MPDEWWELLLPTEMERDVLGLTQQWADDIGLEVVSTVVSDGAGGQEIETTSVTPLGGETEYLNPLMRHGIVDTWRAWVEAEYAPSWY